MLEEASDLDLPDFVQPSGDCHATPATPPLVSPSLQRAPMTPFGAFHSTAASQSLDGATPGEIRTFDWLQDAFNAGGEAAASVVFPRDAQDLGTVAETQRLQDHILSIHPEWRDRWLLVRVVVGVVSVVNIRSTDFTILQHVKLLWIFEGEKYLKGPQCRRTFFVVGSFSFFKNISCVLRKKLCFFLSSVFRLMGAPLAILSFLASNFRSFVTFSKYLVTIFFKRVLLVSSICVLYPDCTPWRISKYCCVHTFWYVILGSISCR